MQLLSKSHKAKYRMADQINCFGSLSK